MFRNLLFYFVFVSSSYFSSAQVTPEITPTTQGLWGSATNSLGETFFVGNNGAVIKRSAGCSPTWQSVSVPITAGLRTIAFTGDSIGIIAGVSGNVLRSTDHGATWSSVASGTTSGLLDIEVVHDSIIVIGGGGSGGNVVIRSTNYGATFTTAISTLPSSPFEIALTESSALVLCGVGGMVYRSTDLGLTWTQITGPFAGTLSTVSFAQSTGIIAGQNGVIYRSTDDGATWTSLNSNSTIFFNGAAALTPAHYMVVGNSGTILESLDSGTTWTSISSNTTQALRSVAQAGSTLLIGGNAGTVLALGGVQGISIFKEDFCTFSDSTQVPSGWSNSSTAAVHALWRFDNPGNKAQAAALLEAPFAIYDASFYGLAQPDSAVLTTSTFSTSGFNTLSLLWHEVFEPNAAFNSKIAIEVFNGSTWQRVYESSGMRNDTQLLGTATGPLHLISARRSIDLSAASSLNQTQLRFIYSGSGSNRQFWAIDNIEVIASTKDLALESILINDSTCAFPLSDQAFVEVKNNSDFSVYPIELAYQLDNGPIAYTAHNVQIAAGNSLLLPVSNAPLLVANGQELSVWLVNHFDSTASNDSIKVSYTGNVPVVDLNGDTLSFCSGDSLVFQAPINADTYQWYFGGVIPVSNTATLIATQAGVYFLEIMANGCTAVDSIVVIEVVLPPNPLSNLPDSLLINDTYTLELPAGLAEIRYEIVHSTGVILDTLIAQNTPFTFTLSGMYSIKAYMAKDSCNQVYQGEVFVKDNLSARAYAQLHGLKLYPNPARENLSILASSGKYGINIRNISGQVIFQADEVLSETHPFTIHINHWPKGSYIIEIIHSNGTRSHALFIKQ